MSFEHLWAEWRHDYVTSVTTPPAAGSGELESQGECVFCRVLAAEEGSEEYVVHRGPFAASVLNAFPYASGHLLVMPVRHVRELDELHSDESAALWEETRAAVVALRRAYMPDGLNLGANLGRAAGAGIPDHLHLHALPRWVGDTSFMTTIAAVRVLPEALAQSRQRLEEAWPR